MAQIICPSHGQTMSNHRCSPCPLKTSWAARKAFALQNGDIHRCGWRGGIWGKTGMMNMMNMESGHVIFFPAKNSFLTEELDDLKNLGIEPERMGTNMGHAKHGKHWELNIWVSWRPLGPIE